MATAEGGRASQGLTVLCRCDVDVDRLKSVSWANIYYINKYIIFFICFKTFWGDPEVRLYELSGPKVVFCLFFLFASFFSS